MSTYPPVVIVGVLAAALLGVGTVATLIITGHASDLASPDVLVVLGFCSTIIATLLSVGAIHGQVSAVHGQVAEVHVQMNSRMDQLLTAARVIAHAAGVAEGQALYEDPPPKP